MIFQPAEEGGAGGAAMVKDGLMTRFGIQEVYGMHNMPGIPLGTFAMKPGPIMAAADKFEIVVQGRGGHGAMPHQCIDPVVISAAIIQATQTIVGRNVDPLEGAVVSITALNGGETFNVIPDKMHMMGTVRTFNPAVQDLVEQRLKDTVVGIAAAMGGSATIDYQRGYPVTSNHAQQTEFAAKVAAEVAGPDRVDTATAPLMGAEDFSFMLLERPGAYIFIGNGDTAGCHQSGL